MLTCPNLADIPNIRHGFFTRGGGVSEGLYASLNVGYGSGDSEASVTTNRARICQALAAPTLCTAYQIHSDKTVIVDEPWAWQNSPQADALVTNRPGIAIGVLTADCLPILLADSRHRVIAAVHAGWKGAFGGIVESALDAMLSLGAKKETILAAIGPAIAQGSYEVGSEFRERFLEQDDENAIYFIPSARAGHYLFDLKSYAKDRLKNAGISQINLLADDTCLQEDTFFSYRRATLRGQTVYGRQLSAIVMG